MSDFNKRLNDALVFYLLSNPEAKGDDRRIRGFKAGAKAALDIAADDIKQSLDPYVPKARRWLQDRATDVNQWTP